MDKTPKILKAGGKEGKSKKKVTNDYNKEMVKSQV